MGIKQSTENKSCWGLNQLLGNTIKIKVDNEVLTGHQTTEVADLLKTND
jgi:hypothetical protein